MSSNNRHIIEKEFGTKRSRKRIRGDTTRANAAVIEYISSAMEGQEDAEDMQIKLFENNSNNASPPRHKVTSEDYDDDEIKRKDTEKYTFRLSLVTYKIPYNHAMLYFCWKHLWWTTPMSFSSSTADCCFWIHPITKKVIMPLSELVLRVSSDMISISKHINKRVDSFEFVANALISMSRKGSCLHTTLVEETVITLGERPRGTPINPVMFYPEKAKAVMEGSRLGFFFDDANGKNIDILMNISQKADPDLSGHPHYIRDMFTIHKSVFQTIAEKEVLKIIE